MVPHAAYHHEMSRRLWTGTTALVLALVLWPAPAAARGVPRDQCFPFERLAPAVRADAEALLLKALDSEALYTVVGGLKPLSSGFASFEIDVQAPDWQAVDRARQAMAHWRCGEALTAGVLAFARVYNGKRPLQAFVANVPRVAALVAERRPFCGALGVSPASTPAEVMLAVEHADEATRFRGYGWLFGYPDAAVDFFVGAWVFQQYTGWLVPRDFRSVPTFARDTNAFVWAVPKGAEDTEAARRIEAAAAPVLAEYRRRRAAYLAPGGRGVLALVRDWFCDARGACDALPADPPLAIHHRLRP
jgi:hypothetical protein